MRKFLVPAIVLGLTVASGSARAQSSVVMFGIVDVGIDYGKSGSFHRWRETSGGGQGGRFGVRGSEDLGGGLSAVFRLEMGINNDTGSLAQGGLAWGRESTVGLASRQWGSIVVGRTLLPYYALSPFIDAFFQGQSGGLLATTRNTSTASRYLLPLMAQARLDNSALYTSPTWGGFQVRLQGGLGEGGTTIGRTWSTTLRYNAGPVDVIASRIRQLGANNANGAINAYQLAGSYDFKVLKLIAGFNRERNDCLTCTGVVARIEGLTPTGAGDFRQWNLGVRVPIDSFTFITQFLKVQDRSNYATNAGNRDAPVLAVGGEYNFSKRTLVWGSVGAVRNRNGSSYALSTGAPPREIGSVGPNNPTSFNAGVGITHFF